ncbi:hypothetical protein HDA32_004652 [Spinactinospora alkalitolerans]|uniref:Uncharacterized protein n=1 Tax=Spinactinospora alkalitolerans TaxID=687207 RepID=A0A852U2A0_9ACTN|nr:hypothetical protein [Spinactinospora alkalitolerans]NYE49532.1 hypothetical protein [Spinactinospora alkalitolerans]
MNHLSRATVLLPLPPLSRTGHRLMVREHGRIAFSSLAAEVTHWLRGHGMITVLCGREPCRRLLDTAAWVAGERLMCSVRSRCHGANVTIWLEDR